MKQRQRLPRTSPLDGAHLAAMVLAPMMMRGPVVRRPAAEAVASRLDTERRACELLRELRDRYGPGPLCVNAFGRPICVVLEREDVGRLLSGSPAPFSPATREKNAALTHFQPDGLLVSRGAIREERRGLAESVLESDRPVHSMGDRFAGVAREEAERLEPAKDLTADDVSRAFWRVIRRVVLGDQARDDDQVTDLLKALRRDANLAYARPKRTIHRDRLLGRIREYLGSPEPGSLVAKVAEESPEPRLKPEGQVPHWLFAFDAAIITALRTLALLAVHPEERERALNDPDRLRACVLDTVRLWPTTLVLLRESTEETEWRGAAVPPRTTFVAMSSYFHRDDRALPYAHRFAPDAWLDEDGAALQDWAIAPFSRGRAQCPGQNLVLHVTASFLAALVGTYGLRLLSPAGIRPDRPPPYMLNHFAVRVSRTSR